MASSLSSPARGSHSAVTPDGLGLHDSDAESLSPSPAYSPTPSDSAKPPRKCCRRPPQSSNSSGSSIGSCSRSVSDAEEQDEGEKGGLDDWEAVADALSADGDPARRLNLDPVVVVAPKTEGRAILRAWRPDDVFRPQSLPNLSKQRGFPASMERRYAGRGILSVPSSCPICYEDLDLTDSSFLPCSCGFHLCLFCHKRILEEDGRCPGCRKQYAPLLGSETGGGGVPPMVHHLSRSCSLRPRT